MAGRIQKLTSSLYWRISLIFLLVLVLLTGAYLLIVSDTAEMYYQESAQRLNRPIAKRIAGEENFQPFAEGELNKAYLDSLFHNVMVYNPGLEVYLLDTEGVILSYFAPGREFMEKVDLNPVRTFMADTADAFITGTDPRNEGVQKPFSVAPVLRNGNPEGFIYVVLQSEEYESVTDRLQRSYMMGLGTRSMALIFVVAFGLGLLLLYMLTRNLNRIIRVVRRFRKGDHSARIDLKSRGELTGLSEDFNEMADTIVRHIKEIESVEKLRRELIANVSHDLRTPLAAIHGYAETLVMKQEDLTPESRLKYAKTILKSTESIRKLVDDLFELSKLEARQISANFESFSLSELLYDISAKYSLLAEQEQVELEVKIPQDGSLIHGDIALIDRVLQNLIDNALKHTPAGGKVTIDLRKKANGMEVHVADTGVGISEDELPFIFDRYRKAANRSKGGTGLGLAIVKKILEMHQAEIFVQSQPNRGTEFWFELRMG